MWVPGFTKIITLRGGARNLILPRIPAHLREHCEGEEVKLTTATIGQAIHGGNMPPMW